MNLNANCVKYLQPSEQINLKLFKCKAYENLYLCLTLNIFTIQNGLCLFLNMNLFVTFQFIILDQVSLEEEN